MADQIRVRMYRIGFGDCFLLSLPVQGNGVTTMRHVLVDCGVHSRASLGNIQDAVNDIEKETHGKLAVVIASHRHRDHIYGYGACLESFNRFEIGEVWLPWIDEPGDHKGAALVARQDALVNRLEASFSSLEASTNPATQAANYALENLRGNELAMHNLRAGFARGAKVSYLKAGQKLAAPSGIAGLAVDVLGPPIDDDFLADMDPQGIHSYLRSPEATDEGNIRPFGAWWSRSPADAAVDVEFKPVLMSDKERTDLQSKLADDSYEGLAFSLDKARNNTSLVLLFRFRGKTLLFPGDAQWGNWHHWLENAGATPVLQQLDFLKVGHHASHNASPKEALDQMTSGRLAAMISTETPKPWDSIPRQKLLDKLNELTKGRYVRSDSLPVGEHEAFDKRKTAAPPPGFSAGAFWIDYFLPL